MMGHVFGKHYDGWKKPFGCLTKKKVRRKMEKASRRRNRAV